MSTEVKRGLRNRVFLPGYERIKYVHGGKERFKEPCFSTNIDTWIRDLNIE